MQNVDLDRLLAQAHNAESELNRLQSGFLATAGHEFRTPLTIIDMAARRLDMRAALIDPEDIRKKTEIIRSTVARIVELVERTIELAQLSTTSFILVPEALSLKTVIETIVQSERSRFPKCEFLADLSGCPDRAIGDARFLELIVEKLLRGSARLVAGAGRIEIAVWLEGDKFVLSVKAVCEVLSSDALKSMEAQLEAFLSAHRLMDDGMEFKLARFLVEMHRGDIEFHTDSSRSLEIEVILPVEFQSGRAGPVAADCEAPPAAPISNVA